MPPQTHLMTWRCRRSGKREPRSLRGYSSSPVGTKAGQSTGDPLLTGTTDSFHTNCTSDTPRCCSVPPPQWEGHGRVGEGGFPSHQMQLGEASLRSPPTHRKNQQKILPSDHSKGKKISSSPRDPFLCWGVKGQGAGNLISGRNGCLLLPIQSTTEQEGGFVRVPRPQPPGS